MSSLIEFTHCSTLCIDAFREETEAGPEKYRATYEVLRDGSVHVTKIERNDARPGKPALWFVDRLDFIAHDQLEKLIAKGVARERLQDRRAAAEVDCDYHRA
jgi:hypothetical protein